MRRGIFFGLIWGGLVSVICLTAASILAEPPSAARVMASTDGEIETDGQGSAEESAASQPESESPQTPVAETRPEAPAPAPMGVTQPTAPVADTSPLAVPEVGSVAEAVEAPQVEDTSITGLATDATETPRGQVSAPAISETQGEVAPVAEETVPAPEPDTSQEQDAAEQGVSSDAPPVVTSEAPAAPEAPATTTADGAAPQTATTTGQNDQIALVVPSEPASENSASLDGAPVPVPAEQAEADTTAQNTPNAQTDRDTATDQATAAPQVQTAPPRIALQSEQGSTLGRPVGTFVDRARNVETNRLPTITAAQPSTEGEEAGESAESDPNAPPLTRFAGVWENPEARPIMSILLVDDGQSTIAPDAVSGFPYPVTVAVDATAPNAADRAAIHRALGIEVLALAQLPQQAGPSDIEVGLEASLANVPEAAGVLIPGDVPGGRQGTAQIMEKLRQSGHGLVTASGGLNTTEQLAESIGFPGANIFDDLDGAGQSATVMRRFLDNAAFRAGQGQDVIMLARLRPETLAALDEWSRSDRASRVALVPVSAVLTAE